MKICSFRYSLCSWRKEGKKVMEGRKEGRKVMEGRKEGYGRKGRKVERKEDRKKGR